MLILEAAINRYLALDPEMLDKLAAFDGKVIKIEISGINKTCYLCPDASGIHLSGEHEGSVDTVLRGSPLSLFKMGLVSNTATMLLKGEVEISGDTRLGHKFKNALSQMDIDWAEPLSELVGDSLAYQLHNSGKNVAQWSKQTLTSVSGSVSEYLQEESRDVVTETELTIFNNKVDQLRDDVDRLQAKINSLASSL
ncbi:MAG: SCP2 sterol-binding domain-containing protein [Gammaproteobacteria bacterium]|nr:SCP2 sterol-binding domain-containing protein [Gammaproteobacteria bacterium]